jgi:biopolymer transport protein ExbD
MRKIGSSSHEVDDSHDDGLINLTPLIDVVFVVLICFILIAPMLEMDRINLASGSDKKEEKSALSQAKVSLTLKEDNTIWIGKDAVALSNLFSELEKLRKRYPGESLKLFPDKKAHFGIYQEIKNIAEAAGFEEMDVVLIPPQKK